MSNLAIENAPIVIFIGGIAAQANKRIWSPGYILGQQFRLYHIELTGYCIPYSQTNGYLRVIVNRNGETVHVLEYNTNNSGDFRLSTTRIFNQGVDYQPGDSISIVIDNDSQLAEIENATLSFRMAVDGHG